MTPLAAALDALVSSRMSEDGIARVSKVEVLEQLKCPLAAFNRVVPELYAHGLFWDGGDTWTRTASLAMVETVAQRTARIMRGHYEALARNEQ